MSIIKKSKKPKLWENEIWYASLKDDGKYIYDLIEKYHNYFKLQDRKFRKRAGNLKVLIMLLAVMNTVILGLNGMICIDVQVIVGLFISAAITFITGVLSYFNLEKYWMRNVAIHIELNIITFLGLPLNSQLNGRCIYIIH